MKKLNNLAFRTTVISNPSTIQGGRRAGYSEEGTYAHVNKITWWPAKFPIKHELHKLNKFNMDL